MLVGAGGGQGVPVRGERHRRHGAGVAGEGLPEPVRPGRVGHVPQDHRLVVAGGGQGAPVRGERHRRTPRRCGRSRGCPSRLRPGRVGHIPQDHRAGRRWRWPGCARPGRTPPTHTVGVAGEGLPEPLRPGRVGHVPQDHRAGRRWRWPGCARPGRTPPTTPQSVWPVRGCPSRCGRAGSVTSHRITVLSPLAVARVRPSGANATDVHRVGVAGEGSPDPLRPGRVGQIPQDHRLVGAGGGQGVPVRGERHRRTPARCGRSGVARAAAAGPGRPHPTGSPSGRRCRWPGCARPGRTPPTDTASVWPVRGCPSRCGRAGSATSHRITVRSSLAVARVRPSGANATDGHGVGVAGEGLPEPLRPGRVGAHPTGSPCWSSLAVARVRPSGANATDVHGVGVAGEGSPEPLRPGRVGRHPTGSPCWSSLAVARVRPSGANATDVHGVGVAGERVARAGCGRAGSAHIPQASPSGRRWRWPGCARPGRTPPTYTAPVWPVERARVAGVDQELDKRCLGFGCRGRGGRAASASRSAVRGSLRDRGLGAG